VEDEIAGVAAVMEADVEVVTADTATTQVVVGIMASAKFPISPEEIFRRLHVDVTESNGKRTFH